MQRNLFFSLPKDLKRHVVSFLFGKPSAVLISEALDMIENGYTPAKHNRVQGLAHAAHTEYPSILEAAFSGNLPLLKSLHATASDILDRAAPFSAEHVEAAVFFGHAPVVQWMVENGALPFNAVKFAVVYGDLPLLAWLAARPDFSFSVCAARIIVRETLTTTHAWWYGDEFDTAVRISRTGIAWMREHLPPHSPHDDILIHVFEYWDWRCCHGTPVFQALADVPEVDWMFAMGYPIDAALAARRWPILWNALIARTEAPAYIDTDSCSCTDGTDSSGSRHSN